MTVMDARMDARREASEPDTAADDATSATPRIVNGLTVRHREQVNVWGCLAIAFVPDTLLLFALVALGVNRLLLDHRCEQPKFGLAAVELNQRPCGVKIGTAAKRGHRWTDRVAMLLPVCDLPHRIAASGNHPARQSEGAGVFINRNAGAIGAVDHRAVEFLLFQRR